MLRTTLTVLSLVGLLLSVGAWLLSYWNLAYVGSQSSLVDGEWGLSRGCFLYSEFSVRSDLSSSWVTRGYDWVCVGFWGLETEWWPQLSMPVFVRIPLWMPTLLFGSIFCLCRPLHHHRRRKRKKLGLCLKCGYDLRASKDRCPECGTTFKR